MASSEEIICSFRRIRLLKVSYSATISLCRSIGGIYIEVSHKKNAMYGEIGISKGYRFQLCTNDKNKFRFWANHDTFSIPTNKEGVEYHISANTIDELKEKVIDAIYDILPQYK